MKENTNFEQLQLSNEMKKTIEEMGYKEATPIQYRAIPYVLGGNDVIGQAQTGTGKTAAIGIPIIEKIDDESKKLQSIILCPTRELAIQFAKEMKKLSAHKKRLKVTPIYGGGSIDAQIRELKRGTQVVVGTPGRVMDHMRRGTLKLNDINMVALDEADEMLNMGFVEDIETILKETPEERQTLLFSATMPKAILDITKRYQREPKLIKVVKKQLTVSNIEQKYFVVKQKDKLELLNRLMIISNPKLAVVFCNTKKMVDELVVQLQSRGFFADAIHGDLSQNQRDKVMNKFRKGIIQILVATDVVARGIDVDDVEVVFNYDLPQFEEYYVHRTGRTGRAGREGKAFSFVSSREIRKLKEIERYTKMKITEAKAPNKEEVEEIKAKRFLQDVKEVAEEQIPSKYYDYIKQLIQDGFNETVLAAGLLKIYMESKDSKSEELENNIQAEVKHTGAEEGMVRLFVNLGRKQKVTTGDFVNNIAREARIKGKEIGKIDIYEKYSFIEVPEEVSEKVIKNVSGIKIKGNKVRLEPSNSRK
ncbi:DEAD/DEAH box helicase [Clostridium sp. KNHs214]|uniref:DEAD/DEAH box helicase n=1 Tax=Clostridium sp. KNHs214 TaxID=1540257 RepID=UPI0005559D22|nr:DEAD/DEAH box helicase [Clostridium sp. KNHs214]